MIAAVGARRWIALAAAAAIVAHAFGMGLLGPGMAETVALQLTAKSAKSPIVGDCPSHAAVAADLSDPRDGAAGAGHAGQSAADQSDTRHDGNPPSCKRCPLGQSGMALGTPPVEPVATAAVRIESATQPVSRILVEAWPYRTPPARAPPGGAA